MPALQYEIGHLRDVSQWFDTHLPHEGGDGVEDLLGHLVEDDPANVVLCEVLESLQDGDRRERSALGVHQEDDRDAELVGDVVGAREGSVERHAVVESHHALDHGDVHGLGGPSEQVAEHRLLHEVGVQVLGPGPDGAGMEHRIYVVGPAFERGDLQPAVHQRLQEPAGDQGLPASAGRCGYHESGKAHLPLTTAMYTGFCPVMR